MRRLILFLLLFYSGYSELYPQEQISFNHLTVKHGLSQSSVTCIFQDKKGFMWFGTQDGLNRYDGYNFKVFKNIANDSTCLAENFIFSILEDDKGVMYVETQTGKFQRYNPSTENFTFTDKASVNLKAGNVSSIAPYLRESNGVEWSGGLSKNVGLTRFDNKTGIAKVYKHNPADPSSLIDDRVYSIMRDKNSNLWLGTMGGLERFDELTGKFIHYRNDPKNSNSLPDNWVWPIYQDSDGHLWLGTVKKGLCKFIPETGTFINYLNNPALPGSLSDNFIFSIYQDKGGVLWIGTNSGGVNYFNEASQVFEHYLHNPENQNSISDNDIISIATDRRGNYWLGTRNSGLNRFNYYTQTYNHYPINQVQVIYQDQAGLLWLGTFSSGLISFDPSTGQSTEYVNKPSDLSSISDNRIYAIDEDKYGNLWIGTNNGGLNKFDRVTGKFTRFMHEENNPQSIGSNSVWSIGEDESGKLWFGSFGSGISVYDPVTKKYSFYKNNPDDAGSIADNNIVRIFKDSHGNMWLGTTHGLSKYIPSKNKFKSYREENGLSNNVIFGILEDHKGFIWLSTNKGLSRFDPLKETFKNYYSDDGLQGDEFNQNAFAKDYHTGRLLFGGPNGFNIFNPDELFQNKYKPPVVLTSYLRYNTDDKEGKPIIEIGASERDSLLLTYKDNIITLSFAALSYYNNYQNQYRYKLEGFNKNWIQLGTNNKITFTNLSPRDYYLRVAASNNDGVWNEQGRAIYIEVLPPWWRTNIAYVSYGLMFIGLLYGLRKFELDRREQKAHLRETELRMKATEAEKRVIEAENERKTKELEEARQLQLSMLPKDLPKIDHLEIAAFMRTATEVGGDYYDFICQQSDVLNVAFGDATGHGLQAGTMVTLMKGFFTSDAAKSQLVDFMNHCSSMIKEIKLGRILMSFSFMRISDHKLTLTSGGMPPLYYYNNELDEVEEVLIQGMPLGAMRKYSYKLVEKDLKSGDVLLLLTDGLPEQMNNDQEMFNYTRVKEHFGNLVQNSPQEIINGLVASGDNWMQQTLQADDISFVVIKVK